MLRLYMGNCYVYLHGAETSTNGYYGVSRELPGISWLVIFSEEGIIETAFPPDDLDDYLTKSGFVLLGSIEEVMS